MPPTSLRVSLTLGLAAGPLLAALLGWPGPALAVSEPERLWTVGDRAFQDGLFAQSRRMLSSYPENANVPSATFYLARTLAELKRPDEAIGLLRGFVSKYPDHRLLPDARYTLGQALIAGGQSDEGVGELRAFAKAYPSSELAPTARRTVVDTLMRQGKKSELAEEDKTLVAQSPATAEGLYDAGLVAGKLGRPRDADTAWARLRKDFPDHPLSGRVSLEMAQSAFAKNSFKDAAALAKAASRSPEDAVRGEAFVLLGESELKQKRHAAAVAAFKSAAEAPALEPAIRYRALAGTGLAYEEQRQWAQAAKFYDEVASKSPDKTLASWAKERLAAVNTNAQSDKGDARPAPKAPAKGSTGKSGGPGAKP